MAEAIATANSNRRRDQPGRHLVADPRQQIGLKRQDDQHQGGDHAARSSITPLTAAPSFNPARWAMYMRTPSPPTDEGRVWLKKAPIMKILSAVTNGSSASRALSTVPQRTTEMMI